MDFEVALFRVHSALVELICATPRRRKVLFVAEIVALVAFLALFGVLLAAHFTFAGSTGCLPAALEQAWQGTNLTMQPNMLLHIRLVDQIAPVLPAGAEPTVLATYKFATTSSVANLPDSLLDSQNFLRFNVTVPATCPEFSGSMNWAYDLLGYDTAVINNLMYSLPTNGYCTREESEESWSWEHALILKADVFQYIMERTAALVLVACGFTLQASVTAMIIRTLLAVACPIMAVPVLALERIFGTRNLNEQAILLSAPWVGIHVLAMRRAGRPLWKFIMAKGIDLILLYFLYQASQFASMLVLYTTSFPAEFPFSVYGFLTIAEYFSLVCVRTTHSIYIFPRFVLLWYALVHFYYFLVPYGFVTLATEVGSIGLVWLILYLNRVFEAPAILRGDIAFDCPRACVTLLPMGTPPSELPSFWTLFMPLSDRIIRIHEMPIPPVAATPEQGAAPAFVTGAGGHVAGGAVAVAINPPRGGHEGQGSGGGSATAAGSTGEGAQQPLIADGHGSDEEYVV